MFIHCLLDLLIQHQYITTIMSKTVKLPNEVSLATGVQLDSLSAVPVFTKFRIVLRKSNRKKYKVWQVKLFIS